MATLYCMLSTQTVCSMEAYSFHPVNVDECM